MKNRSVKLTDYIFDYLTSLGLKDVFMVTGGGAMHLNDSVGKHPKINYYCTHHEQAAAIAAEGYARVSGKMGIVVVTSGPGGTNTLTGLIGQWLDSMPCLYLSGQVKFETTTLAVPQLKLRQLGDQEINIVKMVESVTKYAVFVKDPNSIRYHLERAVYLATHGRPGPVWLDIPLNVQSAMVNPSKMKAYDPKEDELKIDRKVFASKVSQVVELLKKSKRPVVLAGQGIRLSGAIQPFLKLVERLGIPVVTSFNGYDLLPSDHPSYAGHPGTIGNRPGNFTLQNSDCVIFLGTRNNIRQVSYNWSALAREAKKVVVDIDAMELKKPTVKPNVAIHADAKEFIQQLDKKTKKTKMPDYKNWLAWCKERVRRYPATLPEYYEENSPVNPYCFMETLTAVMKENAIAVTGDGTACVTLFQAGSVKKGQRVFWNSGCASMGYDLSASIGASIAAGKKPVVCLAGDGSLQMNIQELQTVIGYKLPIKLFVLNNNGYHSIKQTQDSYFDGRRVGSDPKSGVTFPDILKLAKAYGFPVQKITQHAKMRSEIAKVLSRKGPVVCEVILSEEQKFSPRTSSKKLSDGRMVSKPLEDMFPFLERDEFLDNMLVEPMAE